jgi:hypothetical protein
MDLGTEVGLKRQNQTQSDGKIFAEEDSVCIGEMPVGTKDIKLYKYFFFSNFRIEMIVAI